MINKSGHIGLWLMATAMLLLTASCTSRKKLVKPESPANYEWMTAKMNGELKVQNGTYNFSGTLRMRHDSTIWISASAFMGMESFRTLITRDSVVLVNRMDQTYLEEPLSTVSEKWKTPKTIQECQLLLLNGDISEPVELQWGPYTAIIRYSDIQWNQPQTFPIKINKKYERIKL